MSKILSHEQLQLIPNLYETENQEEKICYVVTPEEHYKYLN